MKGVLIMLTAADPERLRTALTLAAATRALGGTARLFLHEAAAALTVGPHETRTDANWVEHGLPTLKQAWNTALDLGTEIIACQTGLAIANVDAATLDSRITMGGLVGVLAAAGGDRLIVL